MKYLITWDKGRTIGSIGATSSGGMVVEAATSEAAVLEVYNHYEHLQRIKIQEMSKENSNA